MTNCEFVTDRMIQGYCIFRIIWHAAAGKSLQCVQDVGNMEDRYVCTLWPFIEVTIVGHLTQKIPHCVLCP